MSQKISLQVQELHHRFRTYGRNAREWMRKCIMMLPSIERERVWEKKGFGSLAEYAGKLSGMSHKTVIDGLRIVQAVEHMPDIMKVIEVRGVNCVKPVVTLLTQENQKFWAEKISTMSQHTLQMYLHELRLQENILTAPLASLSQNLARPLDIFGEGALSGIVDFTEKQAITAYDSHTSLESNSGPTPESIADSQLPHQKRILAMQLDLDTIERLEKLRGNADWNTLINELLEIREMSLEQQKPYAKETDSRHIPVDIVRHIQRRSKNTCEFPKCKRPYTILHHTQRFALEQVHDPDRIVALCKMHERIIHLGLVESEQIKISEWKLVAEANTTDPRYPVDQVVQKYRQPDSNNS